ncbi:sulfurtransferase [Bacillus massilinigeriensis]|uniref:sulfurtransferase n=1 Tax=Bacillus mediterraneensis TaxID=1805474 RepID=UPI0008F8B352|nr:sulfurtransferase [Bacillus mediterraneensis]
MKHFVNTQWLAERLSDQHTRIVDCRYSLGDPEAGVRAFENGHIPGAVFFDIGKDLSGPVGVHGGRHPLPETEAFRKTLEKNGIHNEMTVILYDAGREPYAARLWWMLKYVGHGNVFILNGGLDAWKSAGFNVVKKIETYPKMSYHISLDSSIIASVGDVRKAVQNEESVLIDAREEKRYLGIEEPIDKKAGHIPGAINMPWLQGYDDIYFKASEEQVERFAKLDKSRQIIVYCGSGITATPNILALKEAGFKNVKLYAGSFSDWISYEDNPVCKSNEEEQL